MKSTQSRLASQVNKVLGDNEHLEAHVAALEAQRDGMLHELQHAAALQVTFHTIKLPVLLCMYALTSSGYSSLGHECKCVTAQN